MRRSAMIDNKLLWVLVKTWLYCTFVCTSVLFTSYPFVGLRVASQGGEEGGDVQVRMSCAQLQLQEGGLEGVHRQALSSRAQGLQARMHC